MYIAAKVAILGKGILPQKYEGCCEIRYHKYMDRIDKKQFVFNPRQLSVDSWEKCHEMYLRANCK